MLVRAHKKNSTPHSFPTIMTAMREAFGDGERSIVKSILAQITAGEDEHRAKEVACETVANLLMANKLLYALSPNDAIWTTLARTIFPGAPTPENTSYWAKIAPMPMPANDMDYFYTMGARHRRARLARERLDYLDEKKQEYSWAYRGACDKYDEARSKLASMPWDQWTDAQKCEMRKLRRALNRMDWIRNKLDEDVECLEDHDVYHAEDNLKAWNGAWHAVPRLKRGGTMIGDGHGNFAPPSGWPRYPASDNEAGA